VDLNVFEIEENNGASARPGEVGGGGEQTQRGKVGERRKLQFGLGGGERGAGRGFVT